MSNFLQLVCEFTFSNLNRLKKISKSGTNLKDDLFLRIEFME